MERHVCYVVKKNRNYFSILCDVFFCFDYRFNYDWEAVDFVPFWSICRRIKIILGEVDCECQHFSES